MAILKGIFRKQTGSIGDMTLRVVNGQTVTSEKVTRNTSKTFAQMVRRVQWANLVNLWRAFEGTLHPSFENRPAMVSDFNAFVSANIGVVPVYLTRDEARQGGSVAAGYQLTRGSLPTIAVTSVGGAAVTDIALGSLTINENTTLEAFSAAVVENNTGWAYGDQISAFVARQTVNEQTSVPYVEVDAYEVTLSDDSETVLADVVDLTAFSTVSGKLGASAPVNGGITWVHSRKTQGGTKVSTQRFMTTNNILSSYQSAAKRDEAILSYGGKVNAAFLTPNIDDEAAFEG